MHVEKTDTYQRILIFYYPIMSLKEITEADRLYQEVLRLKRDIDRIVREFGAILAKNAPTIPDVRYKDPLTGKIYNINRKGD